MVTITLQAPNEFSVASLGKILDEFQLKLINIENTPETTEVSEKDWGEIQLGLEQVENGELISHQEVQYSVSELWKR